MSFFTDAWVMCVGARSQARHGDMSGVIDTLEALERCLREWKAAAEQGESAPTDAQHKTEILQWLATGETGISSEAIAFQMAGIENRRKWHTHPIDPSDFKRCLKLINRIPEIRSRLDEMHPLSIEWNALVENWKEVEDCFMEEAAEWLTVEDSQKRANKTFDLMNKIYAACENDFADRAKKDTL